MFPILPGSVLLSSVLGECSRDFLVL